MLLASVVVLSITSTTVQANNKSDVARQDFKCYLDTNWTPQIGYFSWHAKNTRKNIAGLAGQKLPKTLMSRNRTLYIKSVIECVPLEKTFSNTKARKLEKKFSDLN